jgi:hypothetical protein
MGLTRPSTPFLRRDCKDMDARHRRQVYAVCARQTATAGHDEVEFFVTSASFDISSYFVKIVK